MCDNLKLDLVISDDEELKVKVRKQNKEKLIPKKIKQKIKTVKKASFGQVRFKIYEPKYKKWIAKENRNFFEYFKKVKWFIKQLIY